MGCKPNPGWMATCSSKDVLTDKTVKRRKIRDVSSSRKKNKQRLLSGPILRGGSVWPTHLLYVLNALDDVIALHRLLDGISVAQDPQVLLQRLLNQAGGQGGEVGQLPQHLQHLGNTLTSPQPNPEQICSSDLLALRRLSERHGNEPFQSWSLNGPPCRSSRSD